MDAKLLQSYTQEELRAALDETGAAYEAFRAKKLKLNMARGKPGPEQLDLVMPLLNALPADADPFSESGDDCRNYGLLSGITEAKKLFADNGLTTMDILHNNCFFYGETALCGTRGWFYEEERGIEHDKKVLRREVMRLETSLQAAGEREKLVFLHYPPIYGRYECPEILELLERYRVSLCCYGHLHGKSCQGAFNGWRGCTRFQLLSADYVDFVPVKLME